MKLKYDEETKQRKAQISACLDKYENLQKQIQDCFDRIYSLLQDPACKDEIDRLNKSIDQLRVECEALMTELKQLVSIPDGYVVVED